MAHRGGVVLLSLIVLVGCTRGMPREGHSGFVDDDGWTIPLRDMGLTGHVDALAEPRPWQVKQFSSYDREGGAADASGALEIYGDQIVLADMQGPGCVLRIWSGDPWGELHIYIDNMNRPLIVQDFEGTFGGDLEYHSPGFNLFAPPFAQQTGGGYISYVPIPFTERCRIVALGEVRELPYHVTYAQFIPGTEIRPYRHNLSSSDVAFFRHWKHIWSETAKVRFVDRGDEEYRKSSRQIWPDKNVQLLPLEGPGLLKEIEMYVASKDEEILDHLWMVIYFDRQEQPGVVAPFSQFFAAPPTEDDVKGLATGRDNGRMWCRFPMPYSEFLEVRMISTSDEIAEIEYYFTWENGPVDELLYFNALYQETMTEKGTPVTMAKTRGAGHFVGLNLTVDGAPSFSFMEGDPVIVIDGDATAYHGTGTEDYFNSAEYFEGEPYSTPTHGLLAKEAMAPTRISAYRTHLTDPVPFDRSMEFQLEHGDGNNQEGVRYAGTAFWYQRQKHGGFLPIERLEAYDLDRSESDR